MATMSMQNLAKLLSGLPRGAWVAISEETETVVAYGSDMKTVLEDAKQKGEKDPLIARVPESAATLLL